MFINQECPGKTFNNLFLELDHRISQASLLEFCIARIMGIHMGAAKFVCHDNGILGLQSVNRLAG